MELSFFFTVYITAQSLMGLPGEDGWEAALAKLRGATANAVVLESYRGGVSVDEAVLREARDRFRAAGIETLGGLMPVWGEGFGKRGEGIETRYGFFCYSDEETVAKLEAEIRKLSRLFHRVVIDDAFLTTCRCAECDRFRAGRPWDVARRELLSAVAERWMKAAHEENSGVRLTVKFPQYYDRHHLFGYDAERFPAIFDQVWIGTETRDPETPKYGYTQPYQGYFNARWMRDVAGEKFEGAWFDYLDCDDYLFYEQAVTTSLAAPERIILFCYGERLFGSKTARLAEGAPLLARLRAAAVAPEGLALPKPPNSDGGRDLFIYDDLGMMGIPCVPEGRVISQARNVFLAAQAAEAEGAPDAVRAALEAGGQAIATHDALLRLAARDPDVLTLFGYSPARITDRGADITGFEIDGARVESAGPFRVSGDLEPDGETQVLAWALYGTFDGEKRVPLATAKPQPGGGRAVLWNLSTFGHDAYTMEEHFCVPVRSQLLRLPAAVIGALRDSATQPLGFRIEAPPRVAAYLFEGHVVFVNHTDAPAAVRVHGLDLDRDPARTWSDDTQTAWTDDTLTIPPHRFAAIPRRR
jgi:PAS domain-containing protein